MTAVVSFRAHNLPTLPLAPKKPVFKSYLKIYNFYKFLTLYSIKIHALINPSASNYYNQLFNKSANLIRQLLLFNFVKQAVMLHIADNRVPVSEDYVRQETILESNFYNDQ